jgi:hypothetical protein
MGIGRARKQGKPLGRPRVQVDGARLQVFLPEGFPGTRSPGVVCAIDAFGTFPLSFRVTILQTPSYYAYDTAAVRSFSLCTAYRSIDRISSNEGVFRSSIDPAIGAADSEL